MSLRHRCLYHCTGCLTGRSVHQRLECHRCRWQCVVPACDGADAASDPWIEFTIRRKARYPNGWQQTGYNPFFTSLQVIAPTPLPPSPAPRGRAGRSRTEPSTASPATAAISSATAVTDLTA